MEQPELLWPGPTRLTRAPRQGMVCSVCRLPCPSRLRWSDGWRTVGCMYVLWLTLLGPRPRFGDKSLGIRMVCPHIGTAVLKGLIGCCRRLIIIIFFFLHGFVVVHSYYIYQVYIYIYIPWYIYIYFFFLAWFCSSTLVLYIIYIIYIHTPLCPDI